MSTPLRTALIGLFTLCASALFSQSWSTAFEDDEMQISVSTLTCDQTPYLVFKVVNNTEDQVMTNFKIDYNYGGVSISEVKQGYVIPPNESVEGDCQFIENFMEMLYIELPKLHVVDMNRVDIQLQ